jgi:flagellar hook-associated protein 2
MFDGSSRYATDFQNVIQRAVAIASLPLNQMQAELTVMQKQSNELGTLNTKLASLQTAIANIDTAVSGSSGLAVTTSDTNVTASMTGSVLPGTYTVQVNDLGSYNNAMSLDGLNAVTDPATGNISSATNFTISAGGDSFSFTATNLNDMVSQINSSGLSVQASLVNVGSPSQPDYRLSIQGTKLGALGISLTDDATPTPNELMHTLDDGGLASYNVNGYSVAATSDSRTVEIAPGLSVTLRATTGVDQDPTTITVSRNGDAVKNVLSSFATAYNAMVDELNNNRGQGTGALNGQSIVFDIGQVLQTVRGYAPGSGQFSSIEDLGVSLDKDGHLTFDSSTFDTAVNGHLSDLMTFLGGSETGGFLKMATDAMNQLVDPITGEMQSVISQMNDTITSQNDQISAEQDRVDSLQTTLTNQMAAADAAIAALEQQANYITQLFDAMSTAAKSNQ